ncbi:MAG: M12 family metallo-peptidase, partial [Pseudomonadales bacterium]|nr:M12 family metallo-peptidase [Pseudomonadales bacterium]
LDDSAAIDFRISQTASARIAAIGERFSVDVLVENITAQTRRDVLADFHFVLENTALVSAPSNCAEVQSSAQTPVLRCAMGTFGPGQKKSLHYVVASNADSHPLIFSTAVAGNSRNDLILEVYRDVETDSDGDGISDFNEKLLGSDPNAGRSIRGLENTVIDVMTVVTPDAAALYEDGLQTRINQLFSVANRIYRDSGVAISLRPVALVPADYEPARELALDLDRLTFKSDPAFADIDRLRTIAGADMVVLFRVSGEDAGLCGLAHLGGQETHGDFSAAYQKEFAYSVINIDCVDDSVLAHELGHNMGLAHSRREPGVGGTFPHATGYGVDGRFSTVMANPGDFTGASRVFRFSNPQRVCRGFLCGVQREDAVRGADAAATLNLVRHQIAAYFRSREERLTDLGVISSKSELSSARILAGATADEGLTYGRRFAANTGVRIAALINPAIEHQGLPATLHVLASLGGESFFQLNEAGELIPWDGDFTNLASSGTVGALAPAQELVAFEHFLADEHGLAGQTLDIFFAYRLLDSADTGPGELVYSTRSLSLQFDLN